MFFLSPEDLVVIVTEGQLLNDNHIHEFCEMLKIASNSTFVTQSTCF